MIPMVSIKLNPAELTALRQVDERLMSYNVEMTEVTGGTFWKAYTPGQIDGTEVFPPIRSVEEMANLMQWYDPIDTTNPRLIKLAKEFGPVWIRVSGTWATKTYYDFDGKGMPEGYQSAMTRMQWENMIRFVDTVGGKLLISMANCEGLHHAEEPWNPSEAEKIFALSVELGHPIDAVEFTNEPNILQTTGFPVNYTAEHFRRDQDLFHKWVRENYPNTMIVGPCTIDAMNGGGDEGGMSTAGVGAAFGVTLSTDELLEGCTEKLDVFSYHYYNGISERLASVMPQMHWQPDQTLSEAYLAMAGKCARFAAVSRDKHVPGGQMWVTESGDAGGGGNTWGSTFMDVFRTLNELGEFASVTDGVIFHNTLASSDYGFLKHGTFEPRPNYFAALLWNRLMGKTVYASGEALREGAHVFAHSRKDGKDGVVYLVINNSKTDATSVELPADATVYTLTGRDGLRSRVMQLNGRDLVLGENDDLPCLCGAEVKAGTIELPAASCSFIVL